ncbi:MAG: RNA polymerase sigma factor [Pseudonocardiaceae bacterium]
MTDVSVTELFRRAEAGDQAAWNALVDRYAKLLWSVARAHRLGDADAADVVQTTWMRLVEHFGRIQDPACLPGWLATTARRECLRTLRSAGRRLFADDEDAILDLVDERCAPVDARLLAEERDVALWRCFEQLSARCQVLLRILMATPPPDYATVSATLGMPAGSIGPTRGRCLDQLRKLAAGAGLVAGSEAQGVR